MASAGASLDPVDIFIQSFPNDKELQTYINEEPLSAARIIAKTPYRQKYNVETFRKALQAKLASRSGSGGMSSSGSGEMRMPSSGAAGDSGMMPGMGMGMSNSGGGGSGGFGSSSAASSGGGGGYASYGQGGVLPLLTAEQRFVIWNIFGGTLNGDETKVEIKRINYPMYGTGRGSGAGGEGGIFDSVEQLHALYSAYEPMLRATLRPASTAVAYGQRNGSGITVVDANTGEPLPVVENPSTAMVLYVATPPPSGTRIPDSTSAPAAVSAANAAAGRPAADIESTVAIRAILSAVATPAVASWKVSRYAISLLLAKLTEEKLTAEGNTLLSKIKISEKRKTPLGPVVYWHSMLDLLVKEVAKPPRERRVSTGLLNAAIDAFDAGKTAVTSATDMLKSYYRLMTEYQRTRKTITGNSSIEVPPGLDMTPIAVVSYECDFLLKYMIFIYDARKKAEVRAKYMAEWASLSSMISATLEKNAPEPPSEESFLTWLANSILNVFFKPKGSGLSKQQSITFVDGEPLTALISRNELYLINGTANTIISKGHLCVIKPDLIEKFKEYFEQVEMDIPPIKTRVGLDDYIRSLVRKLTSDDPGANTRGLAHKGINAASIFDTAVSRAKAQIAEELAAEKSAKAAAKAAEATATAASGGPLNMSKYFGERAGKGAVELALAPGRAYNSLKVAATKTGAVLAAPFTATGRFVAAATEGAAGAVGQQVFGSFNPLSGTNPLGLSNSSSTAVTTKFPQYYSRAFEEEVAEARRAQALRAQGSAAAISGAGGGGGSSSASSGGGGGSAASSGGGGGSSSASSGGVAGGKRSREEEEPIGTPGYVTQQGVRPNGKSARGRHEEGDADDDYEGGGYGGSTTGPLSAVGKRSQGGGYRHTRRAAKRHSRRHRIVHRKKTRVNRKRVTRRR